MSANTRIRPGRFAKALPKVLSFRSRRRLMVTCGWARNLGWFASMALGPLHGRRQPVNNSPAPGSKLFWWRETVLFGLAQRRALPVGRMAISPDIRKLPGTSLLHCCKMPKERFGLESGTPGRLCAVRANKTQCYGAGSFGWSVPGLYEDHKGDLWASAETGLWRWMPGPPVHYTFP